MIMIITVIMIMIKLRIMIIIIITIKIISMFNQMVTSEKRLGKLLGFGQNASEIIP